jgi:hypothetical protein
MRFNIAAGRADSVAYRTCLRGRQSIFDNAAGYVPSNVLTTHEVMGLAMVYGIYLEEAVAGD